MNRKKEKIINELREGYKNAQELIRFMDAKAGVTVGFSGMVFVHCMDKFYSNFPCTPTSSIYSFYVLKLILLFVFIAATIIAFLWAFGCIQARGAIKQSGYPRILFPLGNSTDFSLYKKDLSQADKSHEYDELATQVFNVGHILDIKIRKCQIAIKALIIQIFVWGIIMLVFWMDKNI